MTRSIAATFFAFALPAAALAQSAPSQPSVPTSPAPSSSGPLVEKMISPEPPNLDVHPGPRVTSRSKWRTHRRIAARRGAPRWPLERPALAGVALVTPLPPLREPPHIRVPMPAYPVETLAYWFGAPRPDIVCAPAPRDPNLPDPRLYRERPVICEPDNP